jgi:hypothetical protein
VVADPTVLIKDNQFQMWFTSIGLTAKDEDVDGGISFAVSSDGINWEAYESNPLQSLKRIPEDFAAQPSVLFNPFSEKYEMWFNADYPSELLDVGMNGTTGFWYARSDDGLDWVVAREKGRDLLFSEGLDQEKYGFSVGTTVILKDSSYYMYYGSLASKELESFSENPFPYLHVLNKAALNSEGE